MKIQERSSSLLFMLIAIVAIGFIAAVMSAALHYVSPFPGDEWGIGVAFFRDMAYMLIVAEVMLVSGYFFRRNEYDGFWKTFRDSFTRMPLPVMVLVSGATPIFADCWIAFEIVVRSMFELS